LGDNAGQRKREVHVLNTRKKTTQHGAARNCKKGVLSGLKREWPHVGEKKEL